jgi:hypothetical protein
VAVRVRMIHMAVVVAVLGILRVSAIVGMFAHSVHRVYFTRTLGGLRSPCA